jgi:hypothetical protein
LPSNSIAWFQLDGEPLQIQCYQENSILEILEESFIIVGKPPASTTEISQPCDRGNVFKASKTALKNISDDMVDIEDQQSLRMIFESHEIKLGTRISCSHKKLATFGIREVQLALQNTARPNMIKECLRKLEYMIGELEGIDLKRM